VAPAWPANAIFLGVFLGWIFLLSRSDGRVVAWLGGVPFALVSMLGVGMLGGAGGIVPQVAEQAPGWARSCGLDHVFSGAPFAVAMLLLLTNLGLATFRKVRALGAKAWFFSLNHVGLWVVIASAMFGAGDIIRSRMILVEGQAEAMIVDAAGRHGYLPFGLFLQRFYVEQYPEDSGRPGAPKRFAAEVTVLRHNQKFEDVRIEVNKPLRRDGWALYLTNYELSATGQTDQCLIEAVRDPWLPAVYAGIFLMLGGALAMLFCNPFARMP
jgi:cytochrome c biogenesis protein ResB